MATEEITFENLTPGVLASSANEFCGDCVRLRALGRDVIEELPITKDLDISQIIARFAAFAIMCDREVPVPQPNCEAGKCSVIDKSRDCLLKQLKDMTPDERAALVMQLSDTESL